MWAVFLPGNLLGGVFHDQVDAYDTVADLVELDHALGEEAFTYRGEGTWVSNVPFFDGSNRYRVVPVPEDTLTEDRKRMLEYRLEVKNG